MNVVVIVPAYNAARHVKAVLERIAATAVPGLARIVVVNDGSTDDTGTRIAELAAFHALIDQIDRVNKSSPRSPINAHRPPPPPSPPRPPPPCHPPRHP